MTYGILYVLNTNELMVNKNRINTTLSYCWYNILQYLSMGGYCVFVESTCTLLVSWLRGLESGKQPNVTATSVSFLIEIWSLSSYAFHYWYCYYLFVPPLCVVEEKLVLCSYFRWSYTSSINNIDVLKLVRCCFNVLLSCLFKNIPVKAHGYDHVVASSILFIHPKIAQRA